MIGRIKNIAIILFILILSSSFTNNKVINKKVNKLINSYWPNQQVNKIGVVITEDQLNKLTFKYKQSAIQKLSTNNKIVGYIYLATAKSKTDHFNYLVLFSPNLKILTSKVLIYREDYGGEIASKRWLRQFEGKSNGLKMKFGHDIQNISGATISSRSITNGINKLSKQITELKTKNIL